MREVLEKEEQRDIIARQCLECITTKGIENVSTRDFSEATGMSASSLYYWYKNKDEIVIETTKYGLRMIVSELLEYAVKNISTMTVNYEKFLIFLSNHKQTLRVLLQVACSPQYGDRIREYVGDISSLYSVSTEKFSNNLYVSYDELRPVVDLYVSAVVDYVIWNDENKIQRELKMMPTLLRNLESKKNTK